MDTLENSGSFIFWVVTKASKRSTLCDVCFQATARSLALQVKGGLEPDDIIGSFDSEAIATGIALEELARLGVPHHEN